MRRDAWVVLGLLAVGFVLGWFARRLHVRYNLRRRLRTLGMIPCLALASHLEAQSVHAVPDSLIGTPLSTPVIGNWRQGTQAIYCLTWVSERKGRTVLAIIDAEVADVNKSPLCPNPEGGFYPLWIDADYCPPGRKSPFAEYEWFIVRCGPGDISRYWRDLPQSQRAQ